MLSIDVRWFWSFKSGNTDQVSIILSFLVYCGNWHFPNQKFDGVNLINSKISTSKLVHIQFEPKPTYLYKIFHINLCLKK